MGVGFLIFAYLLVAITPSLACVKPAFFPTFGQRLNGTVVQTSVNVSVDQCGRMCALYVECFGFNVRWTDANQTSGDCLILDKRSFDSQFYYREYEIDGSFAFFGLCPAPMVYSVVTGHCFTLVDEFLTWDNALKFCRMLHPAAHLAEMHVLADESVLAELSPHGLRYYVGARRPAGGSVGDVYWQETGVILSAGYTNWADSEPNGSGDCIMLDIYYSSTRISWRDHDCLDPQRSICQYS